MIRALNKKVNARNSKFNGGLNAIVAYKKLSKEARFAVHNGGLIPTLMYGYGSVA